MRGAALVAAITLLATAPAQAKAVPATLPPVDQCKGDASFSQFRATLKRAVAKQDRAALVRLLAPDVVVNFGGSTGPQAFVEQWSFEPDEPEGIWSLLRIMLKLGCARDAGARVIPSLDIQLDPYYEDMTDELALILPGAKLYREAGVQSSRPETIPWTLAAVTSRAGDLFTGVRLPDGREGLVSDLELYEPQGYRMVVKKRRGRWMITAFVAGD